MYGTTVCIGTTVCMVLQYGWYYSMYSTTVCMVCTQYVWYYSMDGTTVWMVRLVTWYHSVMGHIISYNHTMTHGI